MTAVPVEVAGLPPLDAVFELIAGRPLADNGTIERRDFCLVHDDKGNPSCDYNVVKGIWHCHTCDENGGILDLVIATGKGREKRSAIKWLRDNGLLPERAQISKWDTVDEIYEYVNESGVLLYQVGRWNLPNGGKDFRQRRPRPDGKEGWINELKGVTRVPYMLPELLEACARGDVVYVTEGEKDAKRLRRLGLTATTNAQGAKYKWPMSWAEYFRGASRVVVFGDNDDGGIAAANLRGSIIARVVQDTRVVAPIPGVAEHGDVTDWIDGGHTRDEVVALAESAPTAAPYAVGFPEHAVQTLVDDMSDTGNADWFLACVGDDVLYVPEFNDWLGWDGTRWANECVVSKMVRISLDQMRLAAQHYTGTDQDDFKEWAQEARSAGRRRAMLECAKGERFANAKRLDAHKHLLNVRNGVLDCITGELLPHNRDLLLTKITEVEYDPDASCPNFIHWIHQAMDNDEERIAYIQQIMGGTLIGKTGTRRMFFAYGPPGTGKTTIINIMKTLLGDYACSIDFNVVTARPNLSSSGPSPELARLKGMRLIAAVESRDNDRLDAAKLKQFMGGDTVTARHLNQGMIEFQIEGTMFFAGNAQPMIDADESLWSKFKLIPFEHQFENQDLNFFDKVLRPELPGILAWAVKGLRELAANEWKLNDPAIVVTATQQYRDNENRILGFIQECCELAPTANDYNRYKISPVDIRTAYYMWCEGERIRNPLGERAFGNQLAKMNRKSEMVNGKRFWKGIRLNTDWANKILSVEAGQHRNASQNGAPNPDSGDF